MLKILFFVIFRNMASSLGSATSLNTYESDLEADPTDNTNINVVVR